MPLSPTGPNRTVIADINVTPMADVMIVLLIIFMVALEDVATGLRQTGAGEWQVPGPLRARPGGEPRRPVLQPRRAAARAGA